MTSGEPLSKEGNMKIEYKHREGSQPTQPLMVDTTSSKAVIYLRKNIERTTRTDAMTGETVELWEYDEAILSLVEYEQYKSEVGVEVMAQMSADNLDMMDAIATAYEMSIETAENQLVIMDAIADLYEAIANN
jgi:hypothetical protein